MVVFGAASAGAVMPWRTPAVADVWVVFGWVFSRRV